MVNDFDGIPNLHFTITKYLKYNLPYHNFHFSISSWVHQENDGNDYFSPDL